MCNVAKSARVKNKYVLGSSAAVRMDIPTAVVKRQGWGDADRSRFQEQGADVGPAGNQQEKTRE